QLFIAAPPGIAPPVAGARTQDEVDDLVAEVLGVGDTGRLFDLLELGVERRAVEALAGLGIAIVLLLDPAIGEGHEAVEDVLAVLGILLEVGGLDFLAVE